MVETDIGPKRGRGPGKVGQPSKLTPETVEKLKNALIAGSKIESACIYAGISKTVYYQWKEKARADIEAGKVTQYVEFLDTIMRAMELSRTRLEMIVSKAAEQDWKAAAWILERRHPKDYGRKEYIESKDRTGEPEEVNEDDLVRQLIEHPEAQRQIAAILESIPEIKSGEVGGTGEPGSLDKSKALSTLR